LKNNSSLFIHHSSLLFPVQHAASVKRAGGTQRHAALLDVSNDPFFVNDERRPSSKLAFFVENPVSFRDFSSEVAQERNCDFDLFGKFFVCKRAVNADSEDLCFFLFKLGTISLIGL
jgi:hypothetical protein